MSEALYTHIHATKHAGKVVLITGGNSGIGLAAAHRFAREGEQVVIMGRRQQALDQAIAELPAGVIAVQGDVSNDQDVERAVQTTVAQLGRIDIVYANAGVAEFVPTSAITQAQYTKIFDINVKGVLLTVQKAMAHIPSGGAIVITGSICDIQGVPAFGLYAASKAALRSFTRTFASDLKGTGIRVNLVAPGVVITPPYFTDLNMTQEMVDAYTADVAAKAPLGRIGQADEIAKAVSFLASDDASYITGTELYVDGGLAQV
jgi:NAD(P)-dependent dehydrogenase (short-subunit alcohol dehydrogenase family)